MVYAHKILHGLQLSEGTITGFPKNIGIHKGVVSVLWSQDNKLWLQGWNPELKVDIAQIK